MSWWKGAAALAKHPTRAMPADLTDDIRLSSRAVVTATFLNDMWITIGTVYGESAGQWHPNQLDNNDRLLREVATRFSTGLRVLAGDFNNGETDLPFFGILEMHGFKDLQTLASERWGQAMQMTCKCSNRVDFCFISSELQALLTSVHVDQTVWPDHAVVAGRFRGGVRSMPRFVWRQPQQFDRPQFQAEPLETIPPGSATAKYAEAWRLAEQSAVEARCKPVRAACLGRACTLGPRKVLGQAHAPLRAAREGEIQPQFFGTSTHLPNPLVTAKDPAHAAQVWGSIVRAKGFAPSFPEWWATLDHRAHGAPGVFPLTPPSFETASCIYDTCVIALRQLEKTLRANSRAYVRAKRQASPDLIFQDIKQISPDNVDMRIAPKQAKILDIDTDQCCIHLDHMPAWDLQKPVFCLGRQLDIIHVVKVAGFG